jgi:hypothetical protein
MTKKETVVYFDKLQSKSHSHERVVILLPETAKREEKKLLPPVLFDLCRRLPNNITQKALITFQTEEKHVKMFHMILHV